MTVQRMNMPDRDEFRRCLCGRTLQPEQLACQRCTHCTCTQPLPAREYSDGWQCRACSRLIHTLTGATNGTQH